MRNRQTATRASQYTTVEVTFPDGTTAESEVKTTDRTEACKVALERMHNSSGYAVSAK